MTQLVTRIPDELAEQIDALVAEGVVASRSDAVRRALVELLDRYQRRRIGEDIIEGYERIPETDEELAWANDLAVRMIEEEPW